MGSFITLELAILSLPGRNVASDVRNFHAHRILSFGVAATIQYLHPRLLALHDLTNDICTPDDTTGRIRLPALMRDSYMWMENSGLYLAGKYSYNTLHSRQLIQLSQIMVNR